MRNIEDLVCAIRSWSSKYSIFDSKRIYSTLFVILGSGYIWPAEDFLKVARLVLWIFAFDDWADTDATPDALSKKIQYFRDILSGVAYPSDEFSTILRTISDPVNGNAKKLVRFKEMLLKMLEAMRQEASWAQLTPREKKEIGENHYLAASVYSIGSPAYFAYCDYIADLSRADEQTVTELLIKSGLIMRMANDYQTFQKEVTEGNINLMFVSRLDAAALLQRIEKEWEAFKAVYANLRQDCFVRYVWNTTFYTIRFYTHYDFSSVDLQSVSTFFDRIKESSDYCS